MGEPVLRLDNVGVTIDANPILSNVNLEVFPGQRWVVLGPNGGGKSTLLRICGLAQHPSVGDVDFAGQRLGRCDVRPLRARIGISSAALYDSLRPGLAVTDVVMCGHYGALEPWWHTYTESHRDRACELLGQVGLEGSGPRLLGTLSSGERQRALLARALMPEPDLLLLDEPMAGLDLGGRESLVQALDATAGNAQATILVTHHVEEIPPSFDSLLAVAQAKVVACGAIAETLSAKLIGELFGVEVHLDQIDGRWLARAVSAQIR